MAESIDKSWNMHKCTSVTKRSTASIFFKKNEKKIMTKVHRLLKLDPKVCFNYESKLCAE